MTREQRADIIGRLQSRRWRYMTGLGLVVVGLGAALLLTRGESEVAEWGAGYCKDAAAASASTARPPAELRSLAATLDDAPDAVTDDAHAAGTSVERLAAMLSKLAGAKAGSPALLSVQPLAADAEARLTRLQRSPAMAGLACAGGQDVALRTGYEEVLGGPVVDPTKGDATAGANAFDRPTPYTPGADTRGDDPKLDALWDRCAGGDGGACDDLYLAAPYQSGYADFGNTCGGREEPGTSCQPAPD